MKKAPQGAFFYWVICAYQALSIKGLPLLHYNLLLRDYGLT